MILLPLNYNPPGRAAAAAPPFVGWLLRCFLPSAFVIARCHAIVNTFVAGRFSRQLSSTTATAAEAAGEQQAGGEGCEELAAVDHLSPPMVMRPVK